MNKNFELLKGIFGAQVTDLTEDQKKVVSDKLDTILETRVDTKVKLKTEVVEAEAKEKYDSLLKEATTRHEGAVTKVQKVVTENAEKFKARLEKKLKETVQSIEAKKQEEIKLYKEEMVKKIDKYLDYELDKRIPDNFVEAKAQVQILDPIVEGIKKVMEENYIKFDDQNFSLLKDARSDVVKTREELAKTVKENMDINSKLKDLQRRVKISEVCEGLTDTQSERAKKLLESYDVDEMEDRLNSIRDIIIEGTEGKKEEEKFGKEASTETDKGACDKEAENEEADEVEDEEEEEKKKEEEKKDLAENLDPDKAFMDNWLSEFRRQVGK